MKTVTITITENQANILLAIILSDSLDIGSVEKETGDAIVATRLHCIAREIKKALRG